MVQQGRHHAGAGLAGLAGAGAAVQPRRMRVVHRTAAVPGQQHQTCEGAGHTHGAEDAFRVIDPVRLRDPRVIVMRAAIPLRHRGQGRTDAIDQRLVETLCGRIGHGPGPAEAVAQELGGVHQPGCLDKR